METTVIVVVIQFVQPYPAFLTSSFTPHVTLSIPPIHILLPPFLFLSKNKYTPLFSFHNSFIISPNPSSFLHFMGACFSIASSLPPPPLIPTTAKVISLDGHLHEYPTPISVSQVLLTLNSYSSTSTSSSPPDFFLCNSDLLYYDDYIPALDSDDQLHADHIYFLLPTSKLHRPLTASDMAALAVKASLALQNSSTNSRKKGRISPALLLNHSDSEIVNEQTQAPGLKQNSVGKPRGGVGISRSSSVKKLQRLTSRRAKLAVRSFRLRLSTIYEGTIL